MSVDADLLLTSVDHLTLGKPGAHFVTREAEFVDVCREVGEGEAVTVRQ